ncbi:MAG: hypothetical protein JWL93_2555 [Hyphomicrobiales bacterium]|jgi:uncharacterized protein (DUF983 family)|nr:hypothetical protein [Hyphomicrobiales bacterium]
MDQGDYPVMRPVRTGLRGRCPRCGKGKLFSGLLTLAPRCEVCGLDYSFADPADGPAFFVLTFMSVPILALILWFATVYQPPLWLLAAVSLPVLLLGGILPLRPLKGWLVCSQYFHKAEEGRLAPKDRPEA